jgi:hypothetical protein
MTQVYCNDKNVEHSHRDELPPSFDPRGAFAWTLRSAEIARRERQDSQESASDSECR